MATKSALSAFETLLRPTSPRDVTATWPFFWSMLSAHLWLAVYVVAAVLPAQNSTQLERKGESNRLSSGSTVSTDGRLIRCDEDTGRTAPPPLTREPATYEDYVCPALPDDAPYVLSSGTFADMAARRLSLTATRIENVKMALAWASKLRSAKAHFLVLALDDLAHERLLERFVSIANEDMTHIKRSLDEHESVRWNGSVPAAILELHAKGREIIFGPPWVIHAHEPAFDCSVASSDDFRVVALRSDAFASLIVSYWAAAAESCDSIPATFRVALDRASTMSSGRICGLAHKASDIEMDKTESEISPRRSWRLFASGDEWELPWIRRLVSLLDVEEIPRDPVLSNESWLRLVLETHAAILVLNTHRQELLVTLSALLGTGSRPHVGLFVVDESHAVSTALCARFFFVVRVGFGNFSDPNVAGESRDAIDSCRLLVVPLGAPNMTKRPESSRGGASRRRFFWGYMGRIQSASRGRMLQSFSALSAERAAMGKWAASLVHVTAGLDADALARHNWTEGRPWTTEVSWRAGLSGSVPNWAYRSALRDVALVPSPPGTHYECYRTYEAIQAGAVPIVATSYYQRWFGAPFPQIDGGWSLSQLRRIADLVDDGSIDEIARQCTDWWARALDEYPRRVRDFVNGNYKPKMTPKPCNQSLTLIVAANGVPYELTFPAVTNEAELRRIASRFVEARSLTLGVGCDTEDCVRDHLVTSMRAVIPNYCRRLIMIASVPNSGEQELAELLMRFAGLPTGHCADHPVYALVTHAPFDADHVSRCPKPLAPAAAVLHLVRDPINTFRNLLAHNVNTNLSFQQFTHRWLAHHQHWAARDDLPRFMLRYEDLFACHGDSFHNLRASVVETGVLDFISGWMPLSPGHGPDNDSPVASRLDHLCSNGHVFPQNLSQANLEVDYPTYLSLFQEPLRQFGYDVDFRGAQTDFAVPPDSNSI